MDGKQKEEQQTGGLTCPLCHRLPAKHLVDFKSAAVLLRRRAAQDPQKLRLLKGAKSQKEHEWGLVEYLMTCFPGTDFITEDLEPCQHESLYSFFRTETKLETRALDYLSKRLLTQVSQVRYTLESLSQQCKLCVNTISEQRETYIRRKQAEEQKMKIAHQLPPAEETSPMVTMTMEQRLPQSYFSFAQPQALYTGGLPLLYIFPSMQ